MHGAHRVFILRKDPDSGRNFTLGFKLNPNRQGEARLGVSFVGTEARNHALVDADSRRE